MNNCHRSHFLGNHKVSIAILMAIMTVLVFEVLIDATHLPMVCRSAATGQIVQVLDGYGHPTTWKAVKDGRYEFYWVE